MQVAAISARLIAAGCVPFIWATGERASPIPGQGAESQHPGAAEVAAVAGVFREGHNKRPPRRSAPLVIGPPPSPWKKRAVIAIPILMAAVAAMLLVTKDAAAHPGRSAHVPILEKPIAGVRNNYWYDYRSDVEEAEIELRKDLRRAKSDQDEREAWAEYRRELRDARSDYRKEMAEKGYIRRGGVVTVDG